MDNASVRNEGVTILTKHEGGGIPRSRSPPTRGAVVVLFLAILLVGIVWSASPVLGTAVASPLPLTPHAGGPAMQGSGPEVARSAAIRTAPTSPPTIDVTFSPSQNPTDVGLSISFTAEVSGGQRPYTYNFTFGDGTNATGTFGSGGGGTQYGPSHVYGSAGTFNVTVVINDSDGDWGEAWVLVYVNPDLSVSVSPASVATEVGAEVVLTGAYSGGTCPCAVGWSTGDGWVQSGQSTITHAYQSTGVFQAQFSVGDANGDSANQSVAVTVGPGPSVSISASPNPAYLGQQVNFTAQVVGGVPPYTYSWAFGDGGLGGNLSSISHIFTTNGPFEVELTVTDGLGSTGHGLLNVSIALEVTLTPSSSSVSPGQTVYVTPNASGGTQPYAISWPGLPAWCSVQTGGQPHNGSAKCSPPAAGAYTISVRVLDADGRVAASSVVLRVETPGATLLGLPETEALSLIGAALAGGAVATVLVARTVRARGVHDGTKGRTPSSAEDRYSDYHVSTTTSEAGPLASDPARAAATSGGEPPGPPVAPDPMGDLM